MLLPILRRIMVTKALASLLMLLLVALASAQGAVSGTVVLNPLNVPIAVPPAFFGLNVGDTVHRDTSVPFAVLSTNSRVNWAYITPSKGNYNFALIDQLIAYADAHKHADIMYVIADTPAWASSNPTASCIDGPGTCAPPANLQDFDDFVTALTAHVGIRIRYWIVGNEVNDPRQWTGTPAQMVTMVQHARAIIKAANASTVLFTPTTNDVVSGPPWLAEFFAAGGASYVDAVAYHGYYDNVAEHIVTLTSPYRRVLAEANINLPLWDTEGSWGGLNCCTLSVSGPDRGSFLGKYFLLHQSLGEGGFIWYALDGGDTYGGLVSDDGTYTENSATVAYREVAKWMTGASMVPCSANAQGTYACNLSRSTGYKGIVVWNSTTTITYTVPSGMIEQRDLTGSVTPVTAGSSVSIGYAPQLFESASL